MKTIYKDNEKKIYIQAGRKYLYVYTVHKTTKVPMNEYFNKTTDWNDLWNSDMNYVTAFLGDYMFQYGITI